jgi:hypothetical protein
MNAKTEAARRQMIDQQVRTWDVLDARVLDALQAVPREHFVPEAYRGVAFADAPIPIGHGQWMLPPALEGRILQALAPLRGERALEIGTGSGFFAACLAQLTGSTASRSTRTWLRARHAASPRPAFPASRWKRVTPLRAISTPPTKSSRSRAASLRRIAGSSVRWCPAAACSW